MRKFAQPRALARLMLRVALAVLVLAALGPAAAARADVALDAGALSVRVADEPFALEVVDRADGDAFRSVRSGGRYVPLGYAFDLRVPVVNNAFMGYRTDAEAETLWFGATRVLRADERDGELRLLLATDDPLGHRLEATIRRVADGVVTLRSRIAPGSGPLAGHATTSGAAFATAEDERFLGFGERSNAVDQTGRSVFSWAEEGPFSSGEGEAILRPLLPEFTFPTGPETSNFPIPWLVSTRGLGALIERYERSTFHLGDEQNGAWRAEVEAPELALTFVAGPEPADVVRRYSAHAGRQPRPAPWILGPWVQFHDGVPERFAAEDVPTTVAQTYTHYLPCGAGRDGAAERERVLSLERLGMKVTTYFNPHVCLEYEAVYEEAARRGLLVKNAAGEPYVLSNPFTADELVSEVDFTHPEAEAFYGGLLDEAIGHGYAGWMEDFGEYTPTDARLHDGTTGLQSHNRYPVLYHCASTRHTGARAPAVFIRSGFHGVQPCARVVWGGDPSEDWSCSDGLCAAVHQALNLGLSGVAYAGSDIGGFHAVVGPRTTDELNIRWLQFGAVSGVMRTQANGWSPRDNRDERSQVWSPAVQPVWRRYAKLRTQLAPYLAAASEEYQRTGMPIARHLSLVAPRDRSARQQTVFGFGPDLLAAPVVEEGARSRTLRLPPGRWIDLWRSARYDGADGSVALGRPRVLRGGREVTLPAPLDELPLLARAGTVLPLLEPDVDTLADAGGEHVVRASARDDRRRLLAWPHGRSTARMGANGERLVSTERSRSWTLAVRGKAARTYTLQASLATLRRAFRPCAVTLDGRRVEGWRYDRASRVLRARFTTRSGTLAVRACRAST